MLFTRITNLPVLFVLTPTVGTEYALSTNCGLQRQTRRERETDQRAVASCYPSCEMLIDSVTSANRLVSIPSVGEHVLMWRVWAKSARRLTADVARLVSFAAPRRAPRRAACECGVAVHERPAKNNCRAEVDVSLIAQVTPLTSSSEWWRGVWSEVSAVEADNNGKRRVYGCTTRIWCRYDEQERRGERRVGI
jgi:hypothetical protein